MLARRLLAGVITLVCVYALTFVMVVSLPGNPLESGARRLPPETEMALRARYRMDNNWLYFVQFARGAMVLDFGPAFLYPDWTCGQILASALPVSVMLGMAALTLALLFGVPLGVIGAVRRGQPADVAIGAIVLTGISVPTFVTGTALLAAFAVHLKIAPVGGWGTPGHLVLPSIALALPFTAYIARLTRTGMLDVLGSDFLRTALAKGLSRQKVIWKHALKVALLPVLSYLGPAAAQAMTGSFVVEKVFGVPGLGQHFVNAALNRDTGLLLSAVLVFTSLLVLFNLLVDFLYAWMDPRIRGAVSGDA